MYKQDSVLKYRTHLKSFLVSRTPSCRRGCPSAGCPRRGRMGPAGADWGRRHRRARGRGTLAPGTPRACRVPPAACCSCPALPARPARPGGPGARWDHRGSAPSSWAARGPPGWRPASCSGTGEGVRSGIPPQDRWTTAQSWSLPSI